MEELIELANKVQVTKVENSIYAPHPRFSQYKSHTKHVSQEDRRRKFLESLKSNRYDYMSHVRNLAEEKYSQDASDDDLVTEYDEELEVFAPKKISRSYKNQIMLSEWMVEVPSDLTDEWMMVFCPMGTRCLVIAGNRKTTAYFRSGRQMTRFHSLLPGGSKNSNAGSTILDCIVNQREKKFYILDLMCWNNHPVYESEFEFRNFWLLSKYAEVPGLDQVSDTNKHPFFLLPYYPCSKSSLHSAIHSPLPFSESLDGLLFVHKRTHYTPGVTPLCAWLKPYMVPEMLGINVPDSFLEDRPIDYEDMRSQVPASAYEKVAKRKEKENAMQVETESTKTDSSEPSSPANRESL